MKKTISLISCLTTIPTVGAIATLASGCSCFNKQVTVKSIIVNKPNKTDYILGQALDLSGLVVTEVMSDGSTKELTNTEYSTDIQDGTILTETGDKSIKVTLNNSEISSSFSIKVTDPQVIGITKILVTSKPTKDTYFYGEQLDLTGLVVTAVLLNGDTTQLLSDRYTTDPINGSELKELGDKVINVTLKDTEISTSFTVNVNDPKIIGVSKILITSKPTKIAYAKGQSFNTDGLSVVAIMNDGQTMQLSSDKYDVDPANGTVLNDIGEKSVTVTLRDINSYTDTFKITVTDKIITNLEIAHEATKWVYNSKEKLDLTGLKIKATYSDGSVDEDLDKSKYETWPAEGDKVYEGKELTQVFLVYTPDHSCTLESEIMVTSEPKDFSKADWDEINKWVTYYYGEHIQGFEDLMCEHFNITSKKLEDFVGKTNVVKYNGVEHIVEIVGVKHDTIADGELKGKKALFTFRFKNVLCSNNTGTPIIHVWDGSNNKSYIDSTTGIRKFVNTDVLSGIDPEVANMLKTVNKQTLIYSNSTWQLGDYTDKLFVPTTTEVNTSSGTGGSPYAAFIDDTSRIAYLTPEATTVREYWTSTPNTTTSGTTNNWVTWIGGDGKAWPQKKIDEYGESGNGSQLSPFFCI